MNRQKKLQRAEVVLRQARANWEGAEAVLVEAAANRQSTYAAWLKAHTDWARARTERTEMPVLPRTETPWEELLAAVCDAFTHPARSAMICPADISSAPCTCGGHVALERLKAAIAKASKCLSHRGGDR